MITGIPPHYYYFTIMELPKEISNTVNMDNIWRVPSASSMSMTNLACWK